MDCIVGLIVIATLVLGILAISLRVFSEYKDGYIDGYLKGREAGLSEAHKNMEFQEDFRKEGTE